MYTIRKYGRWHFIIIDNNTNLAIKKEKYINSPFAYIDGEATFLTFKKKEDAENWIKDHKDGS